MKGLAIDTIGIIIITLFGVAMLIIFVSGSLNDLAKNAFCYFYQDVFSKSNDACKPKETIPEEIKITAESSKDLAIYIGAYSILCWENSIKSLKTKDTNCYKLIINEGDFEVTETNVTDILANEDGCSLLENSLVKDINGNQIDYPGDCGVNDGLEWDIDGNIIKDQNLILIKYDDSLEKIVVKG